jgi:hypothetical protein
MSSLKPNRRSIDWDAPELKALLQRSEQWQIDKRGVHDSLEVHLHIGTGAAPARVAVLVYERGKELVFETDFPITQGEHVRIDKPVGDQVRHIWGRVVESRAGRREQDIAAGVHVHWVHLD